MKSRLMIAALAAGLFCIASSSASAFDLLGLRKHSGCGCEPACGVDPCCDSGCGLRVGHRLKNLFHRDSCCDSCGMSSGCGCYDACAPQPCSTRPVFGYHLRKAWQMRQRCCASAPSCGCEPACGVDMGHGHGMGCGYEMGCGMEVSCGCNDACAPKWRLGDRLRGLFHRGCGCDAGCGCEPSCGVDLGCGCH